MFLLHHVECFTIEEEIQIRFLKHLACSLFQGFAVDCYLNCIFALYSGDFLFSRFIFLQETALIVNKNELSVLFENAVRNSLHQHILSVFLVDKGKRLFLFQLALTAGLNRSLSKVDLEERRDV